MKKFPVDFYSIFFKGLFYIKPQKNLSFYTPIKVKKFPKILLFYSTKTQSNTLKIGLFDEKNKLRPIKRINISQYLRGKRIGDLEDFKQFYANEYHRPRRTATRFDKHDSDCFLSVSTALKLSPKNQLCEDEGTNEFIIVDTRTIPKWAGFQKNTFNHSLIKII